MNSTQVAFKRCPELLHSDTERSLIAKGAHMSESFYVIRLRGHLSPLWADWFEEMTLLHTPEGETLLYGEIADQPALHGLLIKVRDLGLTLLALNCVHKQDFLLTLRENTGPHRTHCKRHDETSFS